MAFAVVAAVSAQAQLLYKISGNGLTKPSYIIGTYHLAPVSFVDSIPGVKDALASADQVYGELDMSNMFEQESIAKIQAAMMLPEGQTLQTILTAEQQQKLNGVLKELMGMDLTNPMAAAQLGKISPQALVTQLSLLIFLKKSPSFDINHTFDGYFQEQAKAQGKPVGGFETVDFQCKALYGSTSMERQVELLMCFLDHRDWMELHSEQLVKAFFAQDLDAIAEVVDQKMNNACDATAEEDETLIYGRNAEWLKAMPAVMSAKSTFFAVGAAHLVGEQGVLAGLRKSGYTVEGVK